ncbi:MAG: DNA repair protein RecN, partial [Chloroflexota bacterium]
RFEAEISQNPDDDGLRIGDKRLAYGRGGVDSAAFLVSFNAGEYLRPLERVASGGETSRFLLALKSVLASADAMPTLVFDEVDVGVGARSGMVVGERLHDLSRDHQVISITHLPQIAALADHHVAVRKKTSGDRTGVDVRWLESNDRVHEIAHMMSGNASQAALRSAEELLERAGRSIS